MLSIQVALLVGSIHQGAVPAPLPEEVGASAMVAGPSLPGAPRP